MKKSRPLITFSEQEGFKVASQGIQFLKSLPNSQKYSILSGVGKSKTGKSFLLNQILKQPIFEVSSRIGSCTKGILISQKKITNNGLTVLILDTQGFAGINSTDNIDYKLFLITIFISSTIIYNSMGTIDQNSLTGLSNIVQITKNFEKQLQNEPLFTPPNLLWVLRDFSLVLEDKNGNKINSKQYLQNSLIQHKGSNSQINSKNSVRKAIKQIFPERNCETMVIPTFNEFQMHSELNKNIRKQFLIDLSRVEKQALLMVHKSKKTLFGQHLNINSLLQCLELLVNSLNTNNFPNISTLSIQIIQKQKQKYCAEFYQKVQQIKQNFINLKEFDLQPALKEIQQIYDLYQGYMPNKSDQSQNIQLMQIKNQGKKSITQMHSNIRLEQSITNLQQTTQRICKHLQDINNLNYLEQQYAKLLQLLTVFQKCQRVEDCLNQIERAYLKNKLRLNQEQAITNQKLKRQLNNAKQEIINLKRQINCQSKSSLLSNQVAEIQQKQNPSVLGNVIKKKRQLTNQQSGQQTNIPITINKSFYVPYIIIDPFQLKIDISKTLIKQNQKGNTYVQYVLEVKFRGCKWVLNRKYKDFNELQNILKIMFPYFELPVCQTIIKNVILELNVHCKQKIQERRKQLKKYLFELCQFKEIINSRIFQKFIKLNKQYIETKIN